MENKTYILVDTKILAYLAYQRKQRVHMTLENIEDSLRALMFKEPLSNYEVILAYDYGKSRYRQELHPAYKGHRSKAVDKHSEEELERYQQFQHEYRHVLPRLSAALGVRTIGVQGVEADDIISILANTTSSQVIIMSNDHDLFQIVLHHPTRCRQFMPKCHSLVTAEDIKELQGAHDREEFLVAKAIKGDIGDNIKGLMKCGEVCFEEWIAPHRGKRYSREQWKEAFMTLANSHVKYKAHSLYGDITNEQLFDLNMSLGETMVDYSKLNEEESNALREALRAPKVPNKALYLSIFEEAFGCLQTPFGDTIEPPSYPTLRGK